MRTSIDPQLNLLNLREKEIETQRERENYHEIQQLIVIKLNYLFI